MSATTTMTPVVKQRGAGTSASATLGTESVPSPQVAEPIPPSSTRRSEAAAAFIEAVSVVPSSAYFTAEELETIYSLAYAHIDQNDFEGALPLFAFLTQYAPSNVIYLKGLGVCMQQLGNFEYAIGVYSLIALLDPGALDASLRIAECHLALKRPEAAVPLLDLLVSYAQTPQEAHREKHGAARSETGNDALGGKNEAASVKGTGQTADVLAENASVPVQSQTRQVGLKADALLTLLDSSRARRLG